MLFFYETNKTLIKPKKINLSKKIKNNKVINTKNKPAKPNLKKLVDPNSPFAVLEKLL